MRPLPSSSRHANKIFDVPRRMTSYVHRPGLEAKLVRALMAGTPSLTVIGPGGVGKTRMTQELLPRDELCQRFSIQFLDVSTCTDEKEVCHKIAEQFRWRLSHDRCIESLTYQLQNKPNLLLALDGAEGLKSALAKLVPLWLRQCPGLSILLTSRVPLEFEGEHLFRVPPFATGDEAGLAQAMQLFRSRARQADRILDERPETDSKIERMLSLVSGLPLAIELASAQLRYLSLDDLTAQLQANPADLVHPNTNNTGPNVSLQACFDQSWKLMNRWEQAALAQITVFSSVFSMAQAEGVIDNGSWSAAPSRREIVYSLVNQSLIGRSDNEARGTLFVLLRPVRHWASEKLDTLSTTSDILRLDSTQVEMTTGTVTCKTTTTLLTDKERGLLRYLAQRPGTPVSRETLLQEVWEYAAPIVSRTVDSTMRTLRKKVDTGSFAHLKTVRGVGYQFLLLPGQHPARVDAEGRYVQWHLDQLDDLWVSKGKASTAALREFQRKHRLDILMCIEHAIQRGQAGALELLMRRGLSTTQNYTRRFAEALAELGDPTQPSTRFVIVSFFMMSRAYRQAIAWSTDLGEDWKIEYRFQIQYARAQSLSQLGELDSALELLYQLVETKFDKRLDFVILNIQVRIAMVEDWRGDLAKMRAILARPDLPFNKLDTAKSFENDNLPAVSALLMDLNGEIERTRKILEAMYAKAATAENPRGVGAVLEQLGGLYLRQARLGVWPDALGQAKTTLEEASNAYEAVPVGKARCASKMSRLYMEQGRTDEAKALLRRTMELALTLDNTSLLDQELQISSAMLALQHGTKFEARRALDRLGVLLEERMYWHHDLTRQILEAEYCAITGDSAGMQDNLDRTQERLDALGCHPDFSLARELRWTRARLGAQ